MKRVTKPKRKPLGRRLPPANDVEFSPEAMKAFAEGEARQWWKANAPDEFKNLTEAKVLTDSIGDNA